MITAENALKISKSSINPDISGILSNIEDDIIQAAEKGETFISWYLDTVPEYLYERLKEELTKAGYLVTRIKGAFGMTIWIGWES